MNTEHGDTSRPSDLDADNGRQLHSPHQPNLPSDDVVALSSGGSGKRPISSHARLLPGFGAVTPSTRPERFDAIRDMVEELLAEEVARTL